MKLLKKVFNMPLAFVMSSIIGFTFFMHYLIDHNMFKKYYLYMRSFSDVIKGNTVVVMFNTEKLSDEQKEEMLRDLESMSEENLTNCRE